jgi:predicted O-methyltransferase YrrM
VHARLLRRFTAIQRFEERYNLWAIARAVTDRPGALAEVGVYKGGSALILAAVKGHSPLHLFDTFEGMPKVNPATDGLFQEGQFSDSSLQEVRNLLAGYDGLHFHRGIFPDSAEAVARTGLSFKFVHLDVDLYSSTKDALEWFYPKMIRGGIIVSHDYGNVTVPGVKKAFDGFFADKPEAVVPLWYSQAVVTKL